MTYESAHRPVIEKGQQYVQWTDSHQQAAQGMPPCAVRLWEHLLTKYPGGVHQEIDLEEIRFDISKGRNKVYSVQSLKNAMKCLIEKNLLEIIKPFTKRIFRVVANHAGQVKRLINKFVKGQNDLTESKQICENEHSKPDAVVPSYREKHEDTNGVEVEEKSFPQEPEPELLLEKYEPRLKTYAIYRNVWSGDKLVPNPKMKQVLQVLTKVPPDRAERSILAFIGWIKNKREEQIGCKYKALASAIANDWELAQ